MDFAECATAIAVELAQRAGVGIDQWSEEKCDQLAQAATRIALGIFLPEGIDMVSPIYVHHGAAVVFGSEVGDDYAWSTENIANGAGRQATMHDQGAEGTARPKWWQYRIYTQAQATPTVGQAMQNYLKTSDGSHPDNDDGATDAAVSAEDKLKNLRPLKPCVVDEAAANIEYVASGTRQITDRYFGPVLWNDMGSAITNDAAETKAVFTPIYDESQ